MSLLDALAALHDPLTPPARRSAAHHFCEHYKATVAQRLGEVLPLLHSSQPLHARHFGLHTVDGVVRSQWSSLAPDAQRELRASLLGCARDGLLPLLQEAHVVREKLAALLVSVARRDWPMRWTTLLPELVQLATAGATQTQLVLLVFRNLIEDVMGGDDAEGGGGGSNGAASAAMDPRSALSAAAAELLDWLHQCFRHHLAALQAAIAGAANGAAEEERLVLRAALGALGAFCSHLPLAPLLSRQTLVGDAALLLNAPAAALRVGACEVLCALLAKRPRQQAERLELLTQCAAPVLGLPADLYVRLGGSTEEEDYAGFKGLVDVFVGLAQLQLAALGSEPAQAAPLAACLEARARRLHRPC